MSNMAASTKNDRTGVPDPLEIAHKYWIHCNHCYNIYAKSQTKTFLLSCHHILCENCLEAQKLPSNDPSNPIFKCIICTKVVRSRRIGNDMPSHMKELFHPRPWGTDLPSARIAMFQAKHRSHLRNAMAKLNEKVERQNEYMLQKKSELRAETTELHRLKMENLELEKRVRIIIAARRREKENKSNRSELFAERNQPTITTGLDWAGWQKPTNWSVGNSNQPYRESSVTSFSKSIPDKSFRL